MPTKFLISCRSKVMVGIDKAVELIGVVVELEVDISVSSSPMEIERIFRKG